LAASHFMVAASDGMVFFRSVFVAASGRVGRTALEADGFVCAGCGPESTPGACPLKSWWRATSGLTPDPPMAGTEPVSSRFALDLAALDPKPCGTNVFVTGPLSLAFPAALSLAVTGDGATEGRGLFSTVGGVTLASLSGGAGLDACCGIGDNGVVADARGGASPSRRDGAGGAGLTCVSTGWPGIGGDPSLDSRSSVCRGGKGEGWAADSVTSACTIGPASFSVLFAGV
jgi:hypothetical protein